GVVAQRPLLALAEEAAAAGDGEGHHHPVAGPQVLDGGADGDDLTHELVPEDVALLHARHVPVVEVEVGTADRGEGDAHDGVAGIEELRLRNLAQTHVVFAEPAVGLHARTAPCGWPRVVAVSPASRSCFRRRRSSSTLYSLTDPNRIAIERPMAEPGGSYSTSRRTSVPRPPGAGRKRKAPVWCTTPPGSERQAT